MDPATSESVEESERFQALLTSLDPSLLQGYNKFMHEVIVQGNSRFHLPLSRLSHCLFTLNKTTLDFIMDKAIAYYDDRAPSDIKSYGL